jgi:predicted tellurium resistance membrane protein TerC
MELELLLSFLILTFLEIVLGIDNILFISLVTQKLKLEYQRRVRIIGLSLSLVFRLIMLLFIGALLKLSTPFFNYNNIHISIKDLIMILGGLFLIYKATLSIHAEVAHKENDLALKPQYSLFSGIVQIVIIDLVFSFDSLITAVGLTNHIYVIAAAIIVSILFMLAFAGVVNDFILKYPTLKVLALAFILMIGAFLILEGFGTHINKGYIYFAMGFSLAVETINILVKKKS